MSGAASVQLVHKRFPTSRIFNVLCGISAIEQMMVHALQASGYQRDPNSATLLLIDAPHGFAMRELERLDQTSLHVIVTTCNIHPEYWHDLLSFQPAVLLVGDWCLREVEEALNRAVTGERYHRTPGTTSTLTATEQVVLRHVAHGWSNRQIAAHLGKAEQTIANTLNNVYGKLQVQSRVAAALYYWGRSTAST